MIPVRFFPRRFVVSAVIVSSILTFAPAASSAAAVVQAKTVLHDSFTRPYLQSPTIDGDKFGPWRVVYDGMLSDEAGPYLLNGSLILQPDPVTVPEDTLSTLIVSKRSFTRNRIVVSANWKTISQLRQGSPANVWETGWLVWDFQDPEHFTYLLLKPNGWEVGRRDPAYPGGQHFLATGEEMLTPIGMSRTVTVERVGTETNITVDQVPLTRFTVGRNEINGAVGMYSEDALVAFNWFRVQTSY